MSYKIIVGNHIWYFKYILVKHILLAYHKLMEQLIYFDVNLSDANLHLSLLGYIGYC